MTRGGWTHPKGRIRRVSLPLAACCLLLGLGSAEPGSPPKAGSSELEAAPLVQVLELRTAPDHPMRYYIALPVGWTEERTWPIAVTVAGRSLNFDNNIRAFERARRDRPFILVAPVTFSNTDTINAGGYGAFYPEDLIGEMHGASFERRLEFDVSGLRRVLAEVRERYGGAEKAYIAGWSGGGHLTWTMVVSHPDELAGAATAGGDFFRKLAVSQGISTSPARASLPVRAFQGTEDKYLDQILLPEWVRAKVFAEKHGFRNVRLGWLRGQTHGIFAHQILDFFESLWTGVPEEEPPLPPVPEPIRVAELDPTRAMEAPQLVRAAGHPMRYWVSLPRGWERSRVWPVLVTVEGSAGDFEGNARNFAEKQGDLPFIVIAPVALSNAAIVSAHRYPYPHALLAAMNRGGPTARMRFDLSGLVTVLNEVRGLLGGSEKVFLTGYAGGGNLTWAMVFAHPERLAAAAPVSACFWGPFEKTAPPSERSALEVRAFQGMRTSNIMTRISNGDWTKAKSISDELGGFASVSRVQLKEAPHGRAYDAVLAFFASKLSAEADARPTADR